MTRNTIDAFVRRIHQDIPLTHAMSWQIDQIQSHSLRASAPLAPNINDKGTLFGGASAALMTISAWSLVKFNLEQLGLDNDVVIQSCKNRWLRPQNEDVKLICSVDAGLDWNKIKSDLTQGTSTQHIAISCESKSSAKVTCIMNANYVILPKP